ncbi:DNA topoisomerase IB [Bernardetia sp. ABR2-2B]|uniref:DNA topoisomerase IB n=1 Tax=Bernardetia sp. ABR2-2B TaxID=3127472 RepID=UPI0030CDB761
MPLSSISKQNKIPIMVVGNHVYPKYPPHLYYSSDTEKGYTRKKQEKKFVYLSTRGKLLKSERKLKRIEKLVIPPAWTEVWICRNKNGHLQAVGRDERNRKQSIYHPDWKEYRNKTKFLKIQEFGYELPKLRKAITKDLHKKHWNKEKVVALAIELMQEGLLRIGSDRYLNSNRTYGLTTLRRKHIKIDEEVKNKISLCYKAKSNKTRTVSLSNKSLIKKLKECAALSGQELFRYKDENKKWHRINSQDVNDYLDQKMKSHFTAKTFRTWGGSVLTLELFEEAKKELAENQRKKLETILVRKVAKKLGNTISVCRSYYIHPEVLSEVLTKSTEEIEQQTEKFLQQKSKEETEFAKSFSSSLDEYSKYELQLLAILEKSAQKTHEELL